MNFTVLRIKDFGNKKFWILAELNLWEYVESLTEENFNFEVQRKIVKNKYLDDLLTTIKFEEPLPNITLAYKGSKKINNNITNIELEDNNLDILDGLQRTYRLWAFWKIFNTIKNEQFPNLRTAILGIKKKYPDFFDQGVVDSKFFKDNFPEGKIEVDFDKKYKDFTLYFTIWTNLSEYELVRKMLILNAGHKAVSTQHQFEILFLSLWKSISGKLNEVKIIREKEANFSVVKKGERKPGEFIFSSIITSLMSLVLSKPQRISSDLIYKYDLLSENDSNNSLQYAEDIFKSDFILILLSKLYEIDIEIADKIGKEGTVWFGKDTTMNGIFAGVGLYLNISENPNIENIKDEIIKYFDKLKKTITVDLNLKSFNSQYDTVAGRSVNIGILIRTVIMKFVYQKLKEEPLTWNQLFNQEMKK